MSRIIFITALSLLITASPAPAREWGEAGGWTVVEGSDGESCSVALEYDGKGDTMLVVSEFLNGKAGLSVSNTGWSAEKGKEYELQYLLNGNSYVGVAEGTGERYETRKGFVSLFSNTFVADLAAGNGLKIYREDVLVDSLSLTGTAAAVSRMRQCLAYLRGIKAAAERERKRFAHISDDPFAAKAPMPSADNAMPLKLLYSLISEDDYPAAALRGEMEGTVGLTLTVEGDARVSKCTITGSSGHPVLDDETCKIAASRFRFQPARNAAGDAVQSTYSRTIRWELPKPDPVPTPPPPLVIERAIPPK